LDENLNKIQKRVIEDLCNKIGILEGNLSYARSEVQFLYDENILLKKELENSKLGEELDAPEN